MLVKIGKTTTMATDWAVKIEMTVIQNAGAIRPSHNRLFQQVGLAVLMVR